MILKGRVRGIIIYYFAFLSHLDHQIRGMGSF